ncbi:MAG: ABC transporter substrate-binding protein [Gammaproteobacteria bacterium]|nr:ABC transporter substrate-binding protein [Gammaproteobacteria bacterium]
MTALRSLFERRLLVHAVVAVGLALLCQVAPAQSPKPQRIVSLNPCIDAVLVEVADASQILALSHYSHDPAATAMAMERAAPFAVTYGSAEEVIMLQPDLVLTSTMTSSATLRALRDYGVAVQTLPVPQSLVAEREQIRAVAEAAGHEDRGVALIAQIDHAVALAHTKQPPVPALVRQLDGLVPGDGTLVDELLQAAGFANTSADYGLAQWDMLPLELLAANPPQVMLTDVPAGQLARLHPAYARITRQTAVRVLPSRYLRCGGPTLVPALEHLADIRRHLP